MTHRYSAAGLLPLGVRDRLSPDAESGFTLLRTLMDEITTYGYARVQPPLVEYEEELMAHLKGVKRSDLFRFIDPASARTLAVRPDITAQIGRIVSTRMAEAPRPLRLCYSGQVLKMNLSELHPAREHTQVGAELVGKDCTQAALELVRISIAALGKIGVQGISLDITMPDLVETLAQTALPLPQGTLEDVHLALDMKDTSKLKRLNAHAYLPLLQAQGSFVKAQEALLHFAAQAPALHDICAPRLETARAIYEALREEVHITLDPSERRGFEYQTHFGFSLFAAGFAGEIGRGGSYTIVYPDGREEVALGFSLYIDPLLGLAAPDIISNRLFVPLGCSAREAAHWRTLGWVTIAALDAQDEAHKLGCTHILAQGKAVAL